jgi:hypothetical protein
MKDLAQKLLRRERLNRKDSIEIEEVEVEAPPVEEVVRVAIQEKEEYKEFVPPEKPKVVEEIVIPAPTEVVKVDIGPSSLAKLLLSYYNAYQTGSIV